MIGSIPRLHMMGYNEQYDAIKNAIAKKELDLEGAKESIEILYTVISDLTELRKRLDDYIDFDLPELAIYN